MKKTTLRLTTLTVAAAFALTGCAGTIPGDPSEDTTSTSSSSSEDLVDTNPEADAAEDAPADEEPVEDSPTEDPVADYQVTFDETFEWEDGTKATISKPVNYTPSTYAAGGEGYQHHVKMTVKIVNDSSLPLDASFTSPNVTSGEREGDEIFDDNVGGGPTSSILPGRTVSFDVAYGVDDPADVVAEFSPTWDHDYAYWSN